MNAGQRPSDEPLLATLSAPERLALAYARDADRGAWIALLAFDRRLSQLVAPDREPLLNQIRLAWWRDRLGEQPDTVPAGEPLLDRLSAWGAERDTLRRLIDGWETLVGDRPLPESAFDRLAGARGAAMAAMARLSGDDNAEPARIAGLRWGLADLALHLGDQRERGAALALLAEAPRPVTLGRAMRPLAILRALCERAVRENRAIGGVGDWTRAVRIGLTGR